MARVFASFVRSPLIVQSAQAGTLMAVGDVLSQTCIEGNSIASIDYYRTLRFGSIGVFFVGPCLSRWYGFLERRIVMESKGKQALAKMACDQLSFAPVFICLFMGINGTLNQKPIEEIKSAIRRDYTTILITNYKIWPAAQLFNFWVVPLPFRVLFAQTVAVFWNTYLSWMTNRK